ncbi:hypothetical protein [Salinibacter ruber]|uniref:hypothetical protein n=1 Tax=Salinibacter ruber TaxID=146919 RepID=UPI0021673C70|nr:hypothetical protein [Salinibacter ruber]MCS3697036.1 hypothetical protein [Salinibacter ruber]
MRSQKSSVLYVSHYVTPKIVLEYYKIKKELNKSQKLYWIYQGENTPLLLEYGNINLIKFGKKEMKKWHKIMNGRGIVPGNGHVFLLQAKEEINSEYFWFIEYDVRYKGRWGNILRHFNNSEDDFLSSFLEMPFEKEEWEHWATINLPYKKYARSFNPLYRVSRNLLDRVENILESGYWAHNEALLASTCYNEKFNSGELGKKIYDKQKTKPYEKNKWNDEKVSYSYRPAKVTTIFERSGKLVHPVKPLKWFINKYGFYEGAKKYLKIIYVQSKK